MFADDEIDRGMTYAHAWSRLTAVRLLWLARTMEAAARHVGRVERGRDGSSACRGRSTDRLDYTDDGVARSSCSPYTMRPACTRPAQACCT